MTDPEVYSDITSRQGADSLLRTLRIAEVGANWPLFEETLRELHQAGFKVAPIGPLWAVQDTQQKGTPTHA